MPLNESPLDKSLGHISDHAALKVEYDDRGAPRGPLSAFTTSSTRLQHATIHNVLHSDFNALGGTPTLPTDLDSIDDVGHLGYHSQLHAAYNDRNDDRVLLFSEDFSSGNFHKWGQLQWSTSGVIRNGDGDEYSGTGEYSAQVVNAGTGHEQAARFELRNGDIPFSGTERAEISEPGPDDVDLYVTEGEERWFEFDLKFESGFPVPIAGSGWCIFWQWHDLTIGGSPPLCLDIDTDDVIYLANNDASGYQRTAIQAVQRDVWQHWLIHAKFSSNPAIGFAEVIIDDVVKVAQESRRTIIPGDTGNYFKMGIYRDADNTATQILYYDNFKMFA